MNSRDLTRDGYGASRVFYIIEAMVENFITILTAGAFLATLTKALDISDSLTAILSSVVGLSGLFQIITVFIAHKTPVKRWVIPLQLLSHLMLCGLYLIPLFNIKRGIGIIFFVLIIGANALKQVISSARINWFYTLVAPEKRGLYSAILTAISVVGQIFFSLGASFVLDKFIAADNMRGAFTVVSITIFILIVFDIIPLILSREKPENKEKSPSPFKSLDIIFHRRGYRALLMLTSIHAVAIGITQPFLATYQINELGFNLSFIAIIDIVVNVSWIIALLGFGQMSKTKSYALILLCADVANMIAFAFVIFTNAQNGAILFTAYRIFAIIYTAAKAVATRGLIFDLSSPETRTSALAVQAMLTGVISFVTTLITTPIFNHLQKNHAVLFGAEMNAQQVLAVASFTIIAVVNVLWSILYHRLNVKH